MAERDNSRWLIDVASLEIKSGTVELGSKPPAPYQDMMDALKVQYPDRRYQVWRHGTRYWVQRLS